MSEDTHYSEGNILDRRNSTARTNLGVLGKNDQPVVVFDCRMAGVGRSHMLSAKP